MKRRSAEVAARERTVIGRNRIGGNVECRDHHENGRTE
jgi:hypothetical protein